MTTPMTSPNPRDEAGEQLYRFLDLGEVIEAGDECPSDNCERWEPVNRWAIGSPRSAIFKIIRRPAAKPPAIAADAGALADLIDSVAKCHSENAMDQAFLDNSDEIATAVLKLFADRDGEWACTVNRLEDRIEGLNADLESAVEVAFRRGAAEWTRLNYPTLHMRLSDPASLSPAATSGSEAGGEVERLKTALRNVRHAILEGAKGENAVVTCTLWMPGEMISETVVDHITAALGDSHD